ncbi:reverse transcriptase [Apostichopus japonicus]|uniref:Reverse transcriptase n=1 Tax=Stichopus japonicus TaxID=307972 RepID=A0A2G8JUS1_STIJA|nr:reverse transcriptase [Apostichopus japonicus]
MKNGKSPGSDGLPREFYRTFWAIIGPDIRAVFEDAFQNGLLNQSQRLGMITLLPKSGDPLDPHNKRPITLLNVDYKLLAKALCNRLALAMPHLVGDLQTCAVKGHCIQLHPNFRKWISVLYQESFSSVIVNGFCSEVFNVERGCARGALCLHYFIFCLASPSLVFWKRDSSLGSFRALSQDLSIFERATGAKLNPEKTKGLYLGSWRYRDLPFGASWSDQNIKINGIWFGYDAPCDVTWSERAEVFQSRLETFGTRWLSILGKVTVN